MRKGSAVFKVVSITVVVSFLVLDVSALYPLSKISFRDNVTDTLAVWSSLQMPGTREIIGKKGIALAIADWYFSPGIADTERLLNYLGRVLEIEYGEAAENFDLENVRPHPQDPSALIVPYIADRRISPETTVNLLIRPAVNISANELAGYDYTIGSYAVKEFDLEGRPLRAAGTFVQPDISLADSRRGAPAVDVDVRDFRSERATETKMAVARFPSGIEVFPVFQPDIEKSWGILRDRTPSHFKYQLTDGEVRDVPDLAPDHENVRKDVWTVDQHIERFKKDHPDMEVLGFVGNGNILANAHLVSVVKGRKYAIEQELYRIYQGDSRVYPSLVMWNDGHFSIEEVEYLQDGKIIRMGTGTNIRDEVLFVNAGIGILKDGEPYDLAENYEHGYDVRHYLDFPFIPEANAHFGVNLFYDKKGNPVEQLMRDAVSGKPVELPLADKENRLEKGEVTEVITPLTEGQVDSLEENLINEKGYEKVLSAGEVDYGKFFINREEGTIKIGFMRGVNPHNIVCIDNDGNLVSVVVPGESNRSGITFKEAQKVLSDMGMKDAIIFDSGADVMMTMNGENIVESFQKRDRLTSITIFARERTEDPHVAPETGPGESIVPDSADRAPISSGEAEASRQLEEEGITGRLETALNSRRAEGESAANELVGFARTSAKDGAALESIDRKRSTAEMVESIKAALVALDSSSEIIPDEVARRREHVRENIDQIQADGMVAGIIVLARRARRMGQKLIIGLETEWVPGLGKGGHPQNDAMNPLLRELRGIGDTLRSIGLDNVVLVHSGSDVLERDILRTARDTGTGLSNVVVLASQATVEEKLGNLKTEPQNMPFMAGVDNSNINEFYREYPGQEPVIDIISMLTLVLELASGSVVRDPDRIGMIKSGQYDPLARMVILIVPESRPVNPNQLKEEYARKLRALISA